MMRRVAALAFAVLSPKVTGQECAQLHEAEAEEAADPQVDDLQLLQVGVQLKGHKTAGAGLESQMATEYQALASTDQCEDLDNCEDNKLQWMKVSYPARPFDSVDDVSLSSAQGDPKLGGWDGMQLGTMGVTMAMKLDSNGADAKTAYAYVNSFELGMTGHNIVPDEHNPVPGGCCATAMRMYDRETGHYRDIDLLPLVGEALRDKQPYLGFASATHTFFLDKIDGVLHAFLVAQYVVNGTASAGLSNVFLDAIVCLNLEDGKTIKKTAGGLSYFSNFDNLGTFGDESIYKIMFMNDSQNYKEQWHFNGITRFTTLDGVKVLGFTNIDDNSVTLLRDPWTYTPAEGGGKIMQRFGTPGYGIYTHDHKKHYGLSPSHGHLAAIHNLEYYRRTDGTEWITFFANDWVKGEEQEDTKKDADGHSSDDDTKASSAWHFQVNLVPEEKWKAEDGDFPTNYTVQELNGYSPFQGGSCRPLGLKYGANGVFLCGSFIFGPVVYDSRGNFKTFSEHVGLYDVMSYFEADTE